ncbi:nonstructural protein 2 [Acheta domestica mini ambidensovirus]|uniref:Nonstructural protein 2 n=1 Tax=Acheta domestica mini ambidensovirus TaxID=1404345 RepID=V5KDV6_9VIRU|nr:nonstructural protein 2 [Acheta domestica mini ambidensovirus]AGW50717.1 nonstructural protein 2 [Acheta domestica mini ambidensovirus]
MICQQMSVVFKRAKSISTWASLNKVLEKVSCSTISLSEPTVQVLENSFKYFINDFINEQKDLDSSISTQNKDLNISTLSTTATTPITAVSAPCDNPSLEDPDAVQVQDQHVALETNTTTISCSISTRNKRGRCTYKWVPPKLKSSVMKLQLFPTRDCQHNQPRDWWRKSLKQVTTTVTYPFVTSPVMNTAEYHLQQLLLACSRERQDMQEQEKVTKLVELDN